MHAVFVNRGGSGAYTSESLGGRTMKKLIMATAAVLIAAAPVMDHGGKVKWTEPKNAKEWDALDAQQNAQGRAGLVFFTMDG